MTADAGRQFSKTARAYLERLRDASHVRERTLAERLSRSQTPKSLIAARR